MAAFIGALPDDLIKMFETLEVDTTKMLGEMVTAGAEATQKNVSANMPKALCNSLFANGDTVTISRVYKTPSDDGINCQVRIDGYFINRNGVKTPAPLVANMFEYGSSSRDYPKQPFFRRSFNKKEIEKVMLKVQERYIKGD